MSNGSQQAFASPSPLDPFEAVELELALDLEDLPRDGFETCVRQAARAVGGEFLFEMPAGGTVEDASRMAAVRIPHEADTRILFAVLDEAGTSMRVAQRRELGDHFQGLARALVGVLERLRQDPPAPRGA